MPYRRLEPKRIIDTAALLERRVGERFPRANLRKVAHELVNLARDTSVNADRLAQPVWWLRALVAFTILGGALVFVFIGSFLTFNRIESDGFNAVQGIEASINTLVLAGLGLFALVRIEERMKRFAAMKDLHTLTPM